jgi:hypothetical protein
LRQPGKKKSTTKIRRFIFSHLSFNEGLRILINKVSFLLLKKSPSVLTLYSGNILKCPPEQSWNLKKKEK